MLELKPHQIQAVETSPDRQGLFWKMRVGKTPTAISLACSRTDLALVICPKSLVKNWEIEIERWRKGNTKFLVISKETFKRDCQKLPKCDGVWVDECHLGFANYKTQCFKALEWYLKKHNPKVVQLLTGTPYTSSSWSIYSYGKLLGRDWKWWDWKNRFFYDVRMGAKRIPLPIPGKELELQGILRRLGSIIDLKDVADVPDDEDIIETFSLNTEQKKLIKDSFDPLPIVRYTRQHQIESGCLKGDGYREDIIIECEKDKRLMEIAEENDKLIIVSRYLLQLDKYETMFTNRIVYRISGQEKNTASEVARLAENDRKCIVLAQGDTVAGYNLQSFDVVIFASMSYSYVNYEQVKFRVKNMEKKTGCTYIHFITEGDSVDKAVYDCVSKKQNFSIELFNKK